MQEARNILGIDPGSTKIGYGVISYKCRSNFLNPPNGADPQVLGYGYIDLKNHIGQEKRLLHLHEDLKEIFTEYKPHSMAIENIYFFKNAKTFGAVVQSKGVILFTAAQAKINVYEYTPLQVKQTIGGHGKASKNFLQKLVKSSLDINCNIKPDDASDALAIALCHLRHLTNR